MLVGETAGRMKPFTDLELFSDRGVLTSVQVSVSLIRVDEHHGSMEQTSRFELEEQGVGTSFTDPDSPISVQPSSPGLA